MSEPEFADPSYLLTSAAQLLQPYIENIFQLLQTIYQDPHRTEALLRASMGVIGDLSEAFPGGEYSHYFRQDFLTAMARDTRANKEFTSRTIDTARWAREQIKRQSGKCTFRYMIPGFFCFLRLSTSYHLLLPYITI